MSNPLMDLLEGAGYVLDTPGALARGVLAGRPLDRVGGRELLEEWGLLDPNEEGLDAGDVAGFGAEVLLDPLNLVGAGWLGKTASGARSAKSANAASEALRAAGAMPEELIEHLHPSMLDELGAPRKMYHGTQAAFEEFDPAMAREGGFWFTPNAEDASKYAEPEFLPSRAVRDGNPNVRSAFLDARRPGEDFTYDDLVPGHHEVMVKDASQIYAPWIAPRMQGVPSLRNPLMAIIAQNLLARSHGEY